VLGILDDIEAKKRASAYARVKRCKLGELLGSELALSPSDHQALQDAIELVREDAKRPQAERFFTVAWLHDVLNNNQISIGKTVVSEHVRKVCACCEQPGQ
jgi:hypothetical protein